MPSHSIHLLAAYKYCSDAPAEFYIGNVAPDAVRDRFDKDRTHLRNIPMSMRPDALASLAKRLDLSREENVGVLLHLYTDILWDASFLKRYIDSHGENWFLPYREQTAIAGAWIFHNMPEIRMVWDIIADFVSEGSKINLGSIICDCIRLRCTKDCGVECGNIKSMIMYNYEWNKNNNPEPSIDFPPGELNEFAELAANSFALFMCDFI